MLWTLVTLALATDVRVPVAGEVLSADGIGLEGTHNVTFSLIRPNDSVAWTEAQPVVFAAGGFAAALGATNPLAASVFNTSDLRLSVEVAGGPASTPVSIGVTPYAARALSADDAGKLNGLPASAYTYAAGAGLTLTANTFSGAYAAGSGLTLTGTTFAVNTAVLAPAWSSITGVPSGLADGDQDTTYTAGSGLTLTGTTFSATALAWGSLTGVPSDIADGDQDTRYTGSSGVLLTGTTFSADPATVILRPSGCASGDVLTLVGGQWTCNGLGANHNFFLEFNNNVTDTNGNVAFTPTAGLTYRSDVVFAGSHSLSSNVYFRSPADYALGTTNASKVWSLHPSIGDFEFEFYWRHNTDTGYGLMILSNSLAWADSSNSYINSGAVSAPLPSGWALTSYWANNEFHFNTPAGEVFWPSYAGYHTDFRKVKFRRIGNNLELLVNDVSQGVRTMPPVIDDAPSRLLIHGSTNGNVSSYTENPGHSRQAQIDNLKFNRL
jgi:hypothetical protein